MYQEKIVRGKVYEMDENSSKRLLVKILMYVPEETARVRSLGLCCHPLALKFLIFEVITG